MYYPSIGFEVHIELKTQSKMFCGCAADYFGKEPNTQTCPVCLGLPGALPVPNRKAIEWTILLGLALGCKVNLQSKFDRKNYFYPDLPKGYQISQYDRPFCQKGWLKFETRNSKFETNSNDKIQNSKNPSNETMKQCNNVVIRINRVHLEEDTGKLTHAVTQDGEMTLIDFNRSGVPLVEIVTEPDFHDLSAVKEYLKEIQRIVRYLGISDADMERGTMRMEPSISLSRDPNKLADYRVEIKNINSFKFAERAIVYEIRRQTEMLDRGEMPEQETRGYDENRGVTILQRYKENAEDYRYFPEPDIPPFVLTQEFVENLRKGLPELPAEKRERCMREFGLSEYEVGILTEDIEVAKKYEEIVKLVIAKLSETKLKQSSQKQIAASLATLAPRNDNTAREIAKLIINKKIDISKVVTGQCPVTTIIDEINRILQPGQSTISDAGMEKVIKDILSQNEKAVADYKDGKKQVLGFLTGLCMRELKGKADVKVVQAAINKLLK